MAILLFGASGMLGQAIAAEAGRRGRIVVGVSRHGPDRPVDLTGLDTVMQLLERVGPDLVVNAAAVTDLDACERDPGAAYAVNARAVSAMAQYCARAGIQLIQVSTDHFFTGDGDRAHGEGAPVTLVNDYARTKFAAEGFALLAPGALVLRTNVTGTRGWRGQPTFAEWAFDALLRRAPLRLFEDFYTSTIDTPSFARAMFNLVDRGAAGTLNLAARTVSNKRRFVQTLARTLCVSLDWDEAASVSSLPVRRAESLGLDVAKAEAMLGYALPDTQQVCRNLVAQWEQERCVIPLAS